MFFCSNCFVDSEIKDIIEGNNNTIGDCDFCKTRNATIYEIGGDSRIVELFDGLLDIYSPKSDLPNDFPRGKINLMHYILRDNWNIFNEEIDPGTIHRFITELCSDRYNEQPELFDDPVGIRQFQDQTYLEENSILKNNHWNDFAEGIKHKNRFHSNYINTDKLFIFLQCAVKTYREGKNFYRSRICQDKEGFTQEEMGAPPSDKGKDGRVNPVGIRVLYLSDSEETTLHEIRAGVYDFVTIGTFELQQDIKVINLADIDRISPFIGINYGFDLLQYAVNIEHLKMIAREIAKPLRSNNVLDYLPTQYISDYIRSKGYDGIEYASTMCKKGVNLAIFDPNIFKCTSTRVYDIKSILYDYAPIKKESVSTTL